MLVSNDANAAQSRAPGEATRFYDDIGCLAADVRTRADGSVRYVHVTSGSWSKTEDAKFARPLDAKTPMDYGIVAFATEDEARTADRDGRARRWPDIVALVEAR